MFVYLLLPLSRTADGEFIINGKAKRDLQIINIYLKKAYTIKYV